MSRPASADVRMTILLLPVRQCYSDGWHGTRLHPDITSRKATARLTKAGRTTMNGVNQRNNTDQVPIEAISFELPAVRRVNTISIGLGKVLVPPV